MTKTNRFTLIATILLGVLLYTIIRFAADLNVAWNGRTLEPPPPAAADQSQAPPLPGIATNADLLRFLERQGIDANAVIAGYDDWSDARGFAGRHRLFAASGNGRTADAPDAETLLALSEAGHAAASQTLAANRVFDDLPGAVDLYRRAAEQGSTFALLRLGSVLDAIEVTGNGLNAAVAAAIGIDKKPGPTAMGYVLTAIRDGGAPMIDHALLAWLDQLSERTTRDERIAACEWSERTLLDIARARVRWQRPAIVTRPPPVFFSVPGLSGRLPCADTAFPIESLLDLSGCKTTPVLNGAGETLDLYLCQN